MFGQLTHARGRCNVGALFVLPYSHSVTSQLVVLITQGFLMLASKRSSPYKHPRVGDDCYETIVWSSHTYASCRCNAGALFVLPHSVTINLYYHATLNLKPIFGMSYIKSRTYHLKLNLFFLQGREKAAAG